MENILVKLAQLAKKLLHSNDSVVEAQMSSRLLTSESLEVKRQKMSVNKAVFAEIFGEEAPSWWGDFSTVKR